MVILPLWGWEVAWGCGVGGSFLGVTAQTETYRPATRSAILSAQFITIVTRGRVSV